MNMQHNHHLNLRKILIGSVALCFAYATLYLVIFFSIIDFYFEFFINLSVKINHIKELLRASFH